MSWYDNEWGYSNRLVDLVGTGRQVPVTAESHGCQDSRRSARRGGVGRVGACWCAADLNVPLDENGTITDDGRIHASVPTLKALRDAGAQGRRHRPPGPAQGRPGAEVLAGPGRGRAWASSWAGTSSWPATWSAPMRWPAAEGLTDGDVLLLENIRFDPRETSKDDDERAGAGQGELADAGPAMQRRLRLRRVRCRAPQAGLGLRRGHAAAALRGRAGGRRGRGARSKLTNAGERPYAVVLGGSKVSDKLAGHREPGRQGRQHCIIGGGMCFTFLAAQGFRCRQLAAAGGHDRYLPPAARDYGDVIHLPVDVVVADEFAADSPPETVAAEQIPDDKMGLDIGPESVKRVRHAAVQRAKTIFWNGPMGVFEFAAFAAGTKGVAEAIIGATAKGAVQRGRRRRLGRGRAPARSGRGRVLPHLHRRRCVAGIP